MSTKNIIQDGKAHTQLCHEVSTNNVKGKETSILKKQSANIKTFKSKQKKKQMNNHPIFKI